MATALDIITRAHRLLGVSGQGETLTAEMASEGLDALNAMLHEWAAKGVTYAHTDLSQGDTLATPTELDRAVAHLLAVDLAPVYLVGAPFDPMPHWRTVQAVYSDVQSITLPLSLQSFPSSRRWRWRL